MTPLSTDRLRRFKRAYTTRHVPDSSFVGLTRNGVPESGDVVVARVVEVGQHKKLETPQGRKQTIFPDDEIVVCYANRYAPSQYEAVVPAHLGLCGLVAGGGVAAQALGWHADLGEPTSIDVIGFVCGVDGRKVNLAQHRIPSSALGGLRPEPAERPTTIVVCGTSMDSGKTTSAAGIIRGLVTRGLRVGAAKVTGTGSGGDLWLMADAGASPVFDFTWVGLASTYLMGHEQIVDAFVTLTDELYSAGVDVVVVEVADGIFLSETRDLLGSDALRSRCDGVVFAANDAAGAGAGVDLLRRMNLSVVAVSGLLTASPLATRETRATVDVPVLDLEQLWAADHHLLAGTRGQRRLTTRVLVGASPSAGDVPTLAAP